MEGNQKENTLGEWSDSDDDEIIRNIDENTLGVWSDSDDDEIIRNVDENTLGVWSDSCDDEIIRDVDENTLGVRSDSDDDEIIRNVDENTLGVWSDSDDDEIIRNVDENTLGVWSDSCDDEIIRNVEEKPQTGRGRKRKSDEVDEGATASLPEENFYVIESVKEVKSGKFRMTGTDYTIRFNNTVSELDLIESYERTQEIFEHLLNDVTAGMNKKDQVRFVLHSTQLETPISLPFMPLHRLTLEHVFSQFERVIQSNQDFRLNDTVKVDIIHVVAPEGSGRKKTYRSRYRRILT